VVRVEQEDEVERLDHLRLEVAVLTRMGEHHVKEVRRVLERRLRIDRRQAVGLAVGICGDGADLRDEAGGVPGEALLALGDDVRVVGGGRVDHRGEDGHRVRGGREAVEQVAHVLVEHLVLGEEVRKGGQLGAGGKLAVDQEIRGFHEGAFFREFGDVVAAVAEYALFAVDERDGALACTGISVSGVQGDAAGLVSKSGNVDPHFSFGACHGRQLEGLAINVQFHSSVRARRK